MKVIGTLNIHTTGQDLTMKSLVDFVEKYRESDAVLIYSEHDTRGAQWDVVAKEDLSQHYELRVDPDDRWVYAESNPKLARTKSETLQQWRDRFDAALFAAGYYVDDTETPRWVMFGKGRVTVGKKKKSAKDNAKYFYDDVTHYKIYPYYAHESDKPE